MRERSLAHADGISHAHTGASPPHSNSNSFPRNYSDAFRPPPRPQRYSPLSQRPLPPPLPQQQPRLNARRAPQLRPPPTLPLSQRTRPSPPPRQQPCLPQSLQPRLAPPLHQQRPPCPHPLTQQQQHPSLALRRHPHRPRHSHPFPPLRQLSPPRPLRRLHQSLAATADTRHRPRHSHPFPPLRQLSPPRPLRRLHQSLALRRHPHRPRHSHPFPPLRQLQRLPQRPRPALRQLQCRHRRKTPAPTRYANSDTNAYLHRHTYTYTNANPHPPHPRRRRHLPRRQPLGSCDFSGTSRAGHQGQHRKQRRQDLPHAGEPVLLPNGHRRGGRGAPLLHREGGYRGRMEAAGGLRTVGRAEWSRGNAYGDPSIDHIRCERSDPMRILRRRSLPAGARRVRRDRQ